MRTRFFATVGLLALLGCGSNDTPGFTGPTTHFMPGVWDVEFDPLQIDIGTCRLPSMVLTIAQSGVELTGSYESLGEGLCSSGLSFVPVAVGAGSISGSAGDDSASAFLGGPDFELFTAHVGTGLGGHMQRRLSLPGVGPVTLYGDWHATPHVTPSGAGEAEFLRIEPDLVSLGQLDSTHITVTALGHDHQPLATQPPITLTQPDTTAQVTIGPGGWIHADIKLGTFQFRAQSGSARAEAVGVVQQVPTTLWILPHQIAIDRNSAVRLDVYRLDVTGVVMVPGTWSFTSRNPTIATVSGTGLVQAASTLGSTWIVVKSEALIDSVPLNVVAPPVNFALQHHGAALQPGASFNLGLIASDSARLALPDSLIQVAVEDPTLVTADEHGVVTSKGPEGHTRVIISSGGKADTARILVRSAAGPAIVGQVAMGGSVQPYSVAIGPTGAVLIGDINGLGVHRGDLPGAAFPVLDSVGSVVYSIAISPDGTRGYAVVDAPQRVMVIDMATNQVIDSIAPLLNGGTNFSVAVSPDGQFLALGQGAFVRLLNRATLQEVARFPMLNTVLRLAFHPTLPILYASSTDLHEIDLTTLTETRIFGQGMFRRWAYGLALSPDGSQIYVVDDQVALLVFDRASGALIDRVSTDGMNRMGDIAISATQDFIYLAGGTNGDLTIVDRASLVPFSTLPTGSSYHVALDAAGTTAVVPSTDGTVYFVK